MQELISGFLAGSVGTLVSYPFDTIKTRVQKTQPIFKNNVYKGVASPLIGMAIEKSILFFTYDKLNSYNLNDYSKGFLSGIMTTLVVTPFERIKILLQLDKKVKIFDIYRGYSTTLIREVPGFAIYFPIYEKLKEKNHHPFVIGMGCGVGSWSVIYPSDVVKTHIQSSNNPISLKTAFFDVYRKGGILGFYTGFGWALIRSAILHGSVIWGYESSKTIF